MGFTLETGVSAAAVFLQGILSFFSPCVLPLVPLYIGYLAGGAKSVDADGTVRYKRGRVMRNTVFFVLGVSFTFFALGLGFTALGRFFSDNRALFARIGGVLIILFGLYQLGVFRSRALSTERRLPIRLDRLSMNPAVAFLFGFTFSFAWTPCVGPALGSVLIMATSAGSSAQGFLLIGVYTLGFVLPFLAVGLFTGSLLDFFKKHQKAVRYTVKAGGVLMILMGVMMLTGWMNGFTSYLSGLGGAGTSASSAAPSSSVPSDSAAGQGRRSSSSHPASIAMRLSAIMYAFFWASVRWSAKTHGTSLMPSSFAARILPWPAITLKARSMMTGLIKPNSRRDERSFVICSGEWVRALFT